MTLLLHIKEANFHINTIKYSWNYRVIDDIDVFSELKAMLDRAQFMSILPPKLSTKTFADPPNTPVYTNISVFIDSSYVD